MKRSTGFLRRKGDGFVARITWTERASGRRRSRKQTVASREEGMTVLAAWRRELRLAGSVPPGRAVSRRPTLTGPALRSLESVSFELRRLVDTVTLEREEAANDSDVRYLKRSLVRMAEEADDLIQWLSDARLEIAKN